MIHSFRFGDSYRISELCELVLSPSLIIIYVSSNRKQTHDDNVVDDRDGDDQILSDRDLKAAVQKYTAVHAT